MQTSPVATVQGEAHENPALLHHFATAQQQKDAASLGMWLFLVTEVMFFGGMFCAYLVYRYWYFGDFAAASSSIDLTLGTINTAVLICSSLTVAMAIRCAQVGKQKAIVVYLILTIILGLAFLGIKGVEYNQKFDSFRERIGRAADVKRRIGAAAARLLKPGQTVWLDGGTTVYYVAEALADRRPEGLVVVTHNMPAAELLADFDDVDVHLLGGQYFRRTSLLLGPHTVSAARRWRFDVALLGVEGLSREGLWNSLRDVVLLQKAVMRGSAWLALHA